MTIKKILRKVLNILYWIMFCVLIIDAILGQNNIFINIILGLYCIHMGSKLKKKYVYNGMIKDYKEFFSMLEENHKIRYYLYFSGNEEEVEKYSQLVEYGCNRVLEYGKYLLDDKYVSTKQKTEVQSIMEKTKRLRENIQPPV